VKSKEYPAQSYCGCCGREIASGLFCAECGPHLKGSNLPAEERTFFAQHGRSCPLAPRDRFVLMIQVTPDFLRDIWLLMLPWESAKASAVVDRISIPTKQPKHPYKESLTAIVFGSSERISPGEEEPGAMDCPKCGTVQVDLDGFGVLYCPACVYCQHASRSDDVCGFCGKRVTNCPSCHGRGVLKGMEVGFGGVDDGAECGACEGSGIIEEEVVS
jgi:hypothetical protein